MIEGASRVKEKRKKKGGKKGKKGSRQGGSKKSGSSSSSISISGAGSAADNGGGSQKSALPTIVLTAAEEVAASHIVEDHAYSNLEKLHVDVLKESGVGMSALNGLPSWLRRFAAVALQFSHFEQRSLLRVLRAEAQRSR
tara:strand:+ start:145 stop:564 length:420 start_codon:yes stop_codon:yes gene_type:complete